MRNQPGYNYSSNDNVQTPPQLCAQVVSHFRPYGKLLEPCRGDRNFYRELRRWAAVAPSVPASPTLDWCEIQEGRDFYEYSGRVNWIVTNPPWGQLRDPRPADTHPMSFMRKCFEVADNVVLLLTLNHAIGLKARFDWMDEYDMHIREIVLFDTPPKPWPQAGFQNSAVHWQHGYRGDWKRTDWRKEDLCQSKNTPSRTARSPRPASRPRASRASSGS